MIWGPNNLYSDYAIRKRRIGVDDASIISDFKKWGVVGLAQDTAIECYSHLKQLSSININDIYKPWAGVYSNLVSKINSHDFSKGFNTIFSDIEHAYNIYQLSTNKRALDYGLKFLSDKTPATIFTSSNWKSDKVLRNSIPSKNFFDKLNRFVPLVSSNAGDTAYYHLLGFVNIAPEERYATDWWLKNVFHHEYGHAMDYVNGMLRDNTNFKNLWSDVRNMITRDGGKTIFDATVKWIEERYPSVTFAGCKSVFGGDDFSVLQKMCGTLLNDRENEQLGALSDVFCAAMKTKGSKEITLNGYGHWDNYFDNESSQLTEFFAHCSENYWGGNDIFESIMPDAYRKMQMIIKALLGL